VSPNSYRFWAVFRLLPDLSCGIELPIFGCGHLRAGDNVMINRAGKREIERCRMCHNAANSAWRRREGIVPRGSDAIR